MSDVVQAYFEAWNAHDGRRLSSLFHDGGSYEGPTLNMPLKPYDLSAVIAALAAQFSDFVFDITNVVDSAGKAAVEWVMRGVNDGPIKTGVAATGRQLHLAGVDMLTMAGDQIISARRFYDRRAMMEQLGLQVIVEPYHQGQASYGYALHASSGNPNPPGIIALTWIEGRSEAERDRVRAHSGRIVADFLNEPGFIGIVTGFAWKRGFTCTAWENEASLYRALDQHHAEAKQDFRTSGLSPGVWTSVWKPHHLNRLWVRCLICDTPNDAGTDARQCSTCGSELPPRPSYW